MTRDEVLAELKSRRTEFDTRVEAIPLEAMDVPVPGGVHTPKQIVAHVSAYEALMVERLRAARLGETTALERDREGWERFNERIWAEASAEPVDVVLARSARTFLALLEEVGVLGDEELDGMCGVTSAIDPAWLGGHTLAELIGVDGFEHYPMHFGQLEAAAARDTAGAD
jgi:hypothetical protein